MHLLVEVTINKYLKNCKFRYTLTNHISPVLYLSSSYKEVQNTWGKKHRYDVNRQTRRLEKLGELKLCILSTRDEMNLHLSNLFKMYKEKWREEGFASKFESNTIQEYYRIMANKLRDKTLHFSVLLLNNKPISYHFGFLYNSGFYYYTPAYLKEYSQYSPGKVHLNYLIKEGCKQRWVAFDFLKGEEPYKIKWTKDKERTVSIYITPYGRSFKLKWLINGKTKTYKHFGKHYQRMKLLFKK